MKTTSDDHISMYLEMIIDSRKEIDRRINSIIDSLCNLGEPEAKKYRAEFLYLKRRYKNFRYSCLGNSMYEIDIDTLIDEMRGDGIYGEF